MSQETSSTATSSNLEHQLADAMTAIQMLMQNVGALTQQVTTLTNSMGIMQAAQDAQSIPIFQPAPHNQSLPPPPQYQPSPNRLRSHWPRTMQHQHQHPYLFGNRQNQELRNQRLLPLSPFLANGKTQNLSSTLVVYISMDECWNSPQKMPRFIGSYLICNQAQQRSGTII